MQFHLLVIWTFKNANLMFFSAFCSSSFCYKRLKKGLEAILHDNANP